MTIDTKKEFNGIRIGDKVTTDFYSREKNKVRTVKDIYPSPFKSQSTHWIQTTDGVSCDAAWFDKV